GGLVLIIATLAVVAIMSASCAKSTDNNQGAAPSTTAAPNKMGGAVAGPPDQGTPRNGGRLSFGIEAEPEGLDPTRYAFSSSGHFVASAVFDPLTKMDADGKAQPHLAKEIVGSDDNKTWTITLRDGVTFHDGDPLTADVVV